jgi:hypothetical protein
VVESGIVGIPIMFETGLLLRLQIEFFGLRCFLARYWLGGALGFRAVGDSVVGLRGLHNLDTCI